LRLRLFFVPTNIAPRYLLIACNSIHYSQAAILTGRTILAKRKGR